MREGWGTARGTSTSAMFHAALCFCLVAVGAVALGSGPPDEIGGGAATAGDPENETGLYGPGVRKMPDLVRGYVAHVYVPPGYRDDVPAPTFFLPGMLGGVEQAVMRYLIEPAGEFGWLLIGIEGGEDVGSVKKLIRASGRRFNIHPSMRFVLSFGIDDAPTIRLPGETKPMAAGGFLVCPRRAPTFPTRKGIVWITCGDGVEEDFRGPRAAVRNFLELRSRGWRVRMDLHGGTHIPPERLTQEAFTWMVRTYWGRRPKLLPSDAAFIEKFVEAQAAAAEGHMEAGRMWAAYEIARDLKGVASPGQKMLEELCARLQKDGSVVENVKAVEAFNGAAKTLASLADAKSGDNRTQAVRILDAFLERYGTTAAAEDARTVRKVVLWRLEKE